MMQNRLWKFLSVSCALALALLWAIPTWAQSNMEEKEKPAMYTYVAEWNAPRADWPAIDKINASEKDLLTKLVADGTLVGFGWYSTTAHQVEASTQGSWFSAMSMANLMKALDAIKAQPGAQNDVLGRAKHWDFILQSRHYAYHTGSFENSYLRVASWKVKPRSGETFENAVNHYIIPLLDKLLADGAIHGYQVDREAIHSQDPGNVFVALVTNGADGLDKFYAGLEAAEKANPLGGPAFGSSVDDSAHRDYLAFVPYMAHK
jgi:hypothetical protein